MLETSAWLVARYWSKGRFEYYIEARRTKFHLSRYLNRRMFLVYRHYIHVSATTPQNTIQNTIPWRKTGNIKTTKETLSECKKSTKKPKKKSIARINPHQSIFDK